MVLYNPLILFPILLIAVVVYYLLPSSWRRYFLLILSLSFFYSFSPKGTLLLFLLTVFNYFIAIVIQRSQKKHFFRCIAILINITAFTIPRLIEAGAAAKLSISLDYLIPLGIAFFTLQNIGYVLDVSRGIIPAEHNFWNYLLFILFFAKLSAGPIEPARHFLPQVENEHKYDPGKIYWGIFQILWGLFKKVVIADRLTLITDQVFNNPGQYYGLTVITAIIFYSFQIYFDFSGYSDIALGIAHLFGFKLSSNFKRPFLAENINEFWNRWHITFTNWLREYIFFPLRRFFLRQRSSTSPFWALLIPPLLTMLVSGAWHGLQPTYLVWGVYHGLLLFLNTAFMKKKRVQPDKYRILKRLFTFSLVSFGWLFFRPASLGDAGILLQSIFVKSTTYHDLLLEIDTVDMLVSLSIIPFVMGIEIYLEDMHKNWNNLSTGSRWITLLLILLAVSLFGIYQPGNTEFIYAGF